MDKIKYGLGLLLFTLFLPRVDALTYDIKTNVTTVSNNKYEIKLSLDNITGTEYGIGACTMNIELGEGAELNNEVRTIGNWSMEQGRIYLFDTGSPALKNTSFAIIPVLVNADTSVTLSNITCADDEDELSIDDKVVNLVYNKENSNNNGNNTGGNNSQDNEDKGFYNK